MSDSRGGLDLFGSLVEQENIENQADTRELFDTLEHLPLAIKEAVSFITENSMTSSEYLEALVAGYEDVQDLLSEELVDQQQGSEAQNSVVWTWKLSFDHIRKFEPRAAEILSLM